MITTKSTQSETLDDVSTRRPGTRQGGGPGAGPSPRGGWRAAWLSTGLSLGLILGLAGPGWSAEIQVTTTTAASPTECTLADAVATANTGVGTGACQWDGVGDPVIVLEEATYETEGVLPMTILPGVTMTIRGDLFSTAATIRREAADPSANFFKVKGSLTLRSLTLTGGEASAGGAINLFAGGALTIDHCHFFGNSATDKGGAIHSRGALSVTRTTFDGNSAAFRGGAIYGGSVGTITVMASTFVDNTADGDGGAIAIYSNTDPAIDLEIENSTFSSNDAAWGGALAVVRGSASVDMCTFKDNTAMTYGSAISVEQAANASATLKRSAVAGCHDCNPATADLCDGTVISEGDNAAEDASCGLSQASDQADVVLAMSELVANHGTFTAVHVPLCGPGEDCASPLVEQYECEDSAQVFDQRDWFGRNPLYYSLINSGTLCDIGAYESICPEWTGTSRRKTASLETYHASNGPQSRRLPDSGGCPSQRFHFPNADPETTCRVQWEVEVPFSDLVISDVIFLTAPEVCGLDCLAQPEACAAKAACIAPDPAGWTQDQAYTEGFGFEVPCDTDVQSGYLVEYYHTDEPQTLLHWDPINEINEPFVGPAP